MRYLSLCSGIEAASVAWIPLGWEPVAFAEIHPYRCELLAHYWPDVPNLGDLETITEEHIAELGPIDLVVGGTPCQDLSIAGQRAGLDGERSRLFFDFVRIFNAARTIHGARWCLWENTPGAFTSNAGRDFARVVSELVGLDKLDAPADGWGNEGLAVGPRGLAEWSVLDAQWFGLAQRRERVFVVLDSGNWSDRPPVLLEPEGLRGDSPPSRETGAAVAGTLRPSAFDGSRACGGDGRDGLLVPEIAGPLLSSSHGAGWRTGAEEAAGGHLIADEIAEPITATNARMATHAGNNPRPRNVMVHAPVNLVACFDPNQVTSPHNRSSCDSETAALVASPKPPTIALEDESVAVRRLTPVECERLQGFPDGYTAIRRKNGKVTSDTQRYAALGDSIATTVLAWIGRRIMAATGRAL